MANVFVFFLSFYHNFITLSLLSLRFSLTSERLRVHQTSDNTLRIEKVRREDAGTYVCEAKIRGRPINKRLSISVVVNGQYLLASGKRKIIHDIQILSGHCET